VNVEKIVAKKSLPLRDRSFVAESSVITGTALGKPAGAAPPQSEETKKVSDQADFSFRRLHPSNLEPFLGGFDESDCSFL